MTHRLISLAPKIRARRDLILTLELDVPTLERMQRTAKDKLRAKRTLETEVDVWAIRAAISVYQNGGAC